MMAITKRPPCACSGVAAVVIAVLAILNLHGTVSSTWTNVVVLILAIIIAIGAFTGLCCSYLGKCKTEPQQKQG